MFGQFCKVLQPFGLDMQAATGNRFEQFLTCFTYMQHLAALKPQGIETCKTLMMKAGMCALTDLPVCGPEPVRRPCVLLPPGWPPWVATPQDTGQPAPAGRTGADGGLGGGQGQGAHADHPGSKQTSKQAHRDT